MKLNFYLKTLFLLCIFSFGSISLSGQLFVFEDADYGNFVDYSDQDCFDGDQAVMEIEVSGVPLLSGDFVLEIIELDWQYDDAFSGNIQLEGPDGTNMFLANSFDGSFPSHMGVNNGQFFQPRFRTCQVENTLAHDSNSDDAWNNNAAGVFPIQDINAFFPQGYDPNGTWKVKTCILDSETPYFASFGCLIAFGYTCPTVIESTVMTSNASGCDVADGSMSFIVNRGRCNNTGFVNYQIDNGPIEAISIELGVVSEIEFLNDVPPGTYTIGLGTNGVICSAYDITVGADNAMPSPYINCADDKTVAIGTDCSGVVELEPPSYGDDCGFPVQIDYYFIIYPDGTNSGEIDWDPADPWPIETFNQIGDHRIIWQIVDANGLPTGCNQFITTTKVEPTSAVFPLCNTDDWEEIYYCDGIAGIPPQTFDLFISGMDNFSDEYGLESVFFEGRFQGPVDGYATLIDPDGNRYDLFSFGSFPQYDGAVDGELELFFRTCGDIPNHDADIPFNQGGNYQPITPLSIANNIGLDPNGLWQLELCGFTDLQVWELGCFTLNFAPICPVVADFVTEDASCGTSGSITVHESDIVGGGCNDPDGDGIPNYYTSINGGNLQFFDPANGSIRSEVSPGEWTVGFGLTETDLSGNIIFTCLSEYQVTVGGTADNVDPVLMDCPVNQTVELVGGSATWNVLEPTFSDDCGIASSSLVYTEVDGTVNNWTIDPGMAFSYTATMAGTATFVFTVTDNAGNSATCTATITIGENDPCANDNEDPMAFNCAANQTVILSSGSAEFNVVEPNYSDNCGIASYYSSITYTDGAVDNAGENFYEYTQSFEGDNYNYSIIGTGTVIFYWELTDDSGNVGSCQTVITAISDDCVDNEAPRLIDCPVDFTLHMDLDNTKAWSMRTPNATDDCGIAETTMSITHPDGAIEAYVINPGQYYDIMTAVEPGGGEMTLEWTTTDLAGKTSSCSTLVTLNDGALSRYRTPIGFEDGEFVSGARCVDGGTRIPIEVHGEGPMNFDNGIAQVYISASMRFGFNGNVRLISPSGTEALLGAGDQGTLPAFEGWENNPDQSLMLKFRSCGELRAHDADGWDEEDQSIRPIENLTATYNLDNESADGVWYIEFCDYEDADDFVIWDANLRFGSLCPVIHEWETFDASCDAPGSINITSRFPGVCPEYGIVFSADGGNTWQEEQLFDGLDARDHEVAVGYAIANDQGGIDYQCITSRFIEVAGTNDIANPTIQNCPPNQTVEIEGGEATWSVTEPMFMDDCGVASATLDIVYSDGSTEMFDIDPGMSFDYGSTTVGTAVFTWTITDNFGNVTSCETVITITNSVAVEDLEDVLTFNLYPSVTKDFVQLEMELNEANTASLQIIDAQGKLIETMQLQRANMFNERIDFSAYASGLYFINVIVDDQMAGAKVFKM